MAGAFGPYASGIFDLLVANPSAALAQSAAQYQAAPDPGQQAVSGLGPNAVDLGPDPNAPKAAPTISLNPMAGLPPAAPAPSLSAQFGQAAGTKTAPEPEQGSILERSGMGHKVELPQVQLTPVNNKPAAPVEAPPVMFRPVGGGGYTRARELP